MWVIIFCEADLTHSVFLDHFFPQFIKSNVQSDVHFQNTRFVCYNPLQHIYEHNSNVTKCSPTSQHKRAT